MDLSGETDPPAVSASPRNFWGRVLRVCKSKRLIGDFHQISAAALHARGVAAIHPNQVPSTEVDLPQLGPFSERGEIRSTCKKWVRWARNSVNMLHGDSYMGSREIYFGSKVQSMCVIVQELASAPTDQTHTANGPRQTR